MKVWLRLWTKTYSCCI